ncbi:hypothetical protein TARUN_6519 [Trichoderma arundinaceum]|uniref:Enoyl reductase (ER) domain-containing protein n=1 Tax=Trichoderma arundinaceum TaxID=490622 RepID=A0A395NI84_TRIAR|nr:hypothetical protein TARUN_6519 [Trichoderma arundinaceum]
MSLPQTTKVLVKRGQGKAAIEELPLPKLREGHVLVKTKAVSINPTDWKSLHSDNPKSIGLRLGCDFSGEVVALGPGVTNFKVGDRIAGINPGANVLEPEDGSYAEYLIAQADVQLHTPVSDEEAASLGVSVFTVLQLPSDPLATPIPILIYGGSTASGILGIQFAKASGYKVITTSSPRNFDYLKSLGADVVLDYKSPTVVDDIIAASDGELTLAWDCISEGDTPRICAGAFSDKGGKLGTLLGVDPATVHAINPNIDIALTLAYSIFGQPFDRLGGWQEGKPEDNEFAKEFRDLAEQLLREGKVKPSRIELNRGGSGLEGILVGLEELRQNKVSAAKLIYTF